MPSPSSAGHHVFGAIPTTSKPATASSPQRATRTTARVIKSPSEISTKPAPSFSPTPPASNIFLPSAVVSTNSPHRSSRTSTHSHTSQISANKPRNSLQTPPRKSFSPSSRQPPPKSKKNSTTSTTPSARSPQLPLPPQHASSRSRRNINSSCAGKRASTRPAPHFSCGNWIAF